MTPAIDKLSPNERKTFVRAIAAAALEHVLSKLDQQQESIVKQQSSSVAASRAATV